MPVRVRLRAAALNPGNKVSTFRTRPHETKPEDMLYVYRHPPTPRQLALLKAIQTHIDTHGESPSFEELQAALGCKSLRTIAEHIHALRRKGMCEVDYSPSSEGKYLRRALARSLRLTRRGQLYLEHAPLEALMLAARVALEPKQQRLGTENSNGG